MNARPALLPLLLVLVLGSLLSGCISSRNNGNSSIPWSSPASWENQVPGMGNNVGR